jgi:hypothetical protein
VKSYFSTHRCFCSIEKVHIYGEGYFSLWLQIDNITAYLHQCLTNRNLLDKVNVVLLSDHGMTTVTPQRIFNLTQYVNKAFFEILDSSPVLQIHPAEGTPFSVYCSNLYSIILPEPYISTGIFLLENTHIPWILILLIYVEYCREVLLPCHRTQQLLQKLYHLGCPYRPGIWPLFRHIHVVTRSARLLCLVCPSIFLHV